jgi:hypothetical protein
VLQSGALDYMPIVLGHGPYCTVLHCIGGGVLATCIFKNAGYCAPSALLAHRTTHQSTMLLLLLLLLLLPCRSSF